MIDLSQIRPDGHRARIGVITPQTNTTNEVEFNRLAMALEKGGVTCHFTRTPLHSHAADDNFRDMLTDLTKAMDDLRAFSASVSVFGCTSDSMACPADLLIGTMQKGYNVPAVSNAGAILSSLEVLGVKRLVMATPYTEATNTHEASFLERHGYEVVHKAGLGLNTDMERIKLMSRVLPEEVFAHAKAADRPEAEAVLICCTDFNNIDVIAPLEAELGKPVVSSNSVTFWAAMRTLGLDDTIAGYGRLLEGNYALPTATRI